MISHSIENLSNYEDLKFSDLSPDDRQKIYNYNFFVRVLPQMADIELRDIFKRLNRNVVALNMT